MIMSIVIFLAIGALAGWLAGNIMKGKGFGVAGNNIQIGADIIKRAALSDERRQVLAGETGGTDIA